MEEKLCPLLTCSAKEAVHCMEENCAWWRTYYSQARGKTGACALLDIARSIDA